VDSDVGIDGGGNQVTASGVYWHMSTTADPRRPIEPVRLTPEPRWTLVMTVALAAALVVALVVAPVAVLALSDGFDGEVTESPVPPITTVGSTVRVSGGGTPAPG
jgi:hypothetical protein